MARVAIWVLLGTLSSRPVAAQPVSADVRVVGFPAAVATGYVIRAGQWFPILVELRGGGDRHFQGELSCESPDIDGDRVAFTEGPVTLTGGEDRGRKRVWCYATTVDDRRLTLSIRDDRGTTVARVAVPPFELLHNDIQLVLDISQPALPELRQLATSSDPAAPDPGRRWYRDIRTATLPAPDLPDRWFGLEPVQVVVWDDPDPDRLHSAQLQALIEWVHHGGQLVLGLGPSWTRVQKSALASLLPTQPGAGTVEVRSLPRFFERLAADPHTSQFKTPVVVASLRLSDGIRTFWDRLPDGRPLDLISMRLAGSGRVVVVAARLRDLSAVGLREQRGCAALLAEILDLNPIRPEFREAEAQRLDPLGSSTRALHTDLLRPIAFAARGGVLAFAAFGFAASYVVIAGWLSWWWLTRRGQTHLAWPMFAAVGIVASLASLTLASVSRGVTGTVHGVAIVDLESGTHRARAWCWFGYRSPRRQFVDLSLPGKGNYLRPLSGALAAYAAPLHYVARPGQAALLDTPMRATLKQFEGFWTGSLSGTIRTSLVVDRASGRLTPESWILNDLDEDLAGGYVLYPDPRLRAAPARVAGFETNWRGEPVPPAVNVIALEVGPIRSGERVGSLGQADYERLERHLELAFTGPAAMRPDLPSLWLRQNHEWMPSLFGRFKGDSDLARSAALLLSTRNLYLHNRDTYDSVGVPVSGQGLTDRDVTHWLMRGQAVLLLLAREPGPARLMGDGAALPVSGWSLYRVRAPLSFTEGADTSQADGLPESGP